MDERVSLMGMRIDHVTESDVLATISDALARGQGGWVITPNLHQLRSYRRDSELHDFFDQADLVLADGMPLVWASRLKGTPLPGRVPGSDLIWSLSEEAAREGRSVLVVGGDRKSGWIAMRRLHERCPGLRIAGMVHPPHGFDSDPDALERIAEALEHAQPDIVYVGLGFPKQERVIALLRERFPRVWFLGIGMSIEFVGGELGRAPRWMQRAGLEWVHRLVHEPRRLGKRYLFEGVPFGVRLLAHGAVARLRAPEVPALPAAAIELAAEVAADAADPLAAAADA
ncbi:MAG TPA: WecB/TagA/CpsF family glycosyltransferase [Thermoleophilaceae bacterium]|jgi:N-acetylglucosaminyldiphosphoundecaprenol N-acetyl-beta-D-mannosaminyltransferase